MNTHLQQCDLAIKFGQYKPFSLSWAITKIFCITLIISPHHVATLPHTNQWLPDSICKEISIVVISLKQSLYLKHIWGTHTFLVLSEHQAIHVTNSFVMVPFVCTSRQHKLRASGSTKGCRHCLCPSPTCVDIGSRAVVAGVFFRGRQTPHPRLIRRPTAPPPPLSEMDVCTEYCTQINAQ